MESSWNLEKNEAHIWIIENLNALSPEFNTNAVEILSSEEYELYRATLSKKAKQQFLASRYMIRSVLTFYRPGTRPDEWIFLKNSYGKPYLDPTKHACGLYFNISHTDSIIILIVSKHESIGIDIERNGRIGNGLDLAKNFFSNLEIQHIEESLAEGNESEFYKIWTLKEAYLKALGIGLTASLRSFEFVFSKPMNDFHLSSNLCECPHKWAFWSSQISDTYSIAIALKKIRKNSKIRLATFSASPNDFFKEINLHFYQFNNAEKRAINNGR